MRWCAAPSPLTIREEGDLDTALTGTLALDASARRLSRLIEFTDATRSEGIHMRLARWCESTQGRLRLGVRQRRGLPRRAARAGQPVRRRCHRVSRQRADARAGHALPVPRASASCSMVGEFVCWMDEFWRLLVRSVLRGVRQGRPEDLAQAQRRDVPRDAERERRARQPDQPHDHRADADQDPVPESGRQRRPSTSRASACRSANSSSSRSSSSPARGSS